MITFTSIPDALTELQQGRMLIVVDDEGREGEGDLVIAAEKITPQAINFMINYARGIVCLTVTEKLVKRLDIPLMTERLKHSDQAMFTMSIEAVHGVTSGVSVYDRARTIQVAIDPQSTPADIAMPGHVFPIQARAGGVLVRQGHTEASVDLAFLAGFEPAAVICEIMKEDGSMARLPELVEFAKIHHLKIVAIQDLVAYRRKEDAVF